MSQKHHCAFQVREAGEEAWLGKAAPEVPQLDHPPAETHTSAAPSQAAIGNHELGGQVPGSTVSLDITAADNSNALLATGQPATAKLQRIILHDPVAMGVADEAQLGRCTADSAQ